MVSPEKKNNNIIKKKLKKKKKQRPFLKPAINRDKGLDLDPEWDPVLTDQFSQETTPRALPVENDVKIDQQFPEIIKSLVADYAKW